MSIIDDDDEAQYNTRPTITQKRLQLFVQTTTQTIVQYLRKKLGPGIKNMNEITTNIFCSDFESSLNINALKENRIKYIINLSELSKPEQALAAYKKNGISHIDVTIDDHPRQPLGDTLLYTYKLINEVLMKKEKILIHCAKGISRAPSIILGYLLRRSYLISFHKYLALGNKNQDSWLEQNDFMKIRDLAHPLSSTLLPLMEYVKTSRSCIEPNPGFVYQLLMYEQEIKNDLQDIIIKLTLEEKRNKPALSNSESDDESNDNIPEPSLSKQLKTKQTKKQTPIKRAAPVQEKQAKHDTLQQLIDLEISTDELPELQPSAVPESDNDESSGEESAVAPVVLVVSKKSKDPIASNEIDDILNNPPMDDVNATTTPIITNDDIIDDLDF